MPLNRSLWSLGKALERTARQQKAFTSMQSLRFKGGVFDEKCLHCFVKDG